MSPLATVVNEQRKRCALNKACGMNDTVWNRVWIRYSQTDITSTSIILLTGAKFSVMYIIPCKDTCKREGVPCMQG
jgi:hypothetical protein